MKNGFCMGYTYSNLAGHLNHISSENSSIDYPTHQTYSFVFAALPRKRQLTEPSGVGIWPGSDAASKTDMEKRF